MFRKTAGQLAVLIVSFLAPAALSGGANTWTVGRTVGAAEGAPRLVAADPGNPYVVYGVFGPALYRSGDGGRSWSLIRTFDRIDSLLVQPASTATIYVAAADGDSYGVLKSTDGGRTWASSVPLGSVYSLAGSPTDPSTVFAGGLDRIYRSVDAGVTWSENSYLGVIASLVVDPRRPSTVYAGAEGFEYLVDYPGSVGKSTDGGAHWQNLGPTNIDSALSVAVDAVAPSTVYAAVGPIAENGEGSNTAAADLLRSEDGGLSWESAREGLPAGNVRSLAVDPNVSGTLYAGTGSGVYRSRDAGRSWTPFGQRLAGLAVSSLVIADSGRRLHAVTNGGIYDLELARGALDVAAGTSGASRLLVWDGNRLGVASVDASGHWTDSAPGDPSATWTAVGIAAAGGDLTHVLWQNGDGRSSLEVVGPAGRLSATVFEKVPGWIASDLAVRADGQTDVLWTNADGRMRIARVELSGAATQGPVYGPTPGWSAVAIADGPGDDAWVLWRSADGRVALSLHHDGTMASSFRFAAHLNWSCEDVTVGPDGLPRILSTNPSGLATVVTIDAAGLSTAARTYGVPGFKPRRIAAGPDGQTRLLFGSDDGQAELLLLDVDNASTARHALHPLASVVVTTTAELEAALTPGNSGKQILVRAGEYEVGQPLTVPDHATLVGEGRMNFDAEGRPTGFGSSGRTLLRSSPGLVGDVLTLGDGAAARGLVIEDALGRQAGNNVMVSSRATDDFVSAKVAACEIVNPNPSGALPQGPIGRGLVAMTRNPNAGQDPPAHESARIEVTMKHSIIRSPGGGHGVFAINFAAHSQVRLTLEDNVIGGGLNATGGVSRPDAVTEASTVIHSERNLYRSDSAEPTPIGWSFFGGTTAPIPGLVLAASTSNRLRMSSRDDRVEGFALGLSAVAGLRTVATSEPSSSNRVDMELTGTRVDSTAADLVLFGAQSLVDGASPGDRNVLRLSLRGAVGSGPRDNRYADSQSPSMADLGTDNRLEISGSAAEFVETNAGFEPAPPAEFFTEPE